jgi:hypothetical protein
VESTTVVVTAHDVADESTTVAATFQVVADASRTAWVTLHVVAVVAPTVVVLLPAAGRMIRVPPPMIPTGWGVPYRRYLLMEPPSLSSG